MNAATLAAVAYSIVTHMNRVPNYDKFEMMGPERHALLRHLSELQRRLEILEAGFHKEAARSK